ncbi:hypothetical protein HJG43_03735 [Kineosporiaceae bacterium SCSIO 59966]|nr:hypothetical protein HJG43_03735 [Kineosporiaceae bacterium SCSIO 59966]
MRWESLFDDLEAQMAAAEAAEDAAEVADRVRAELARTSLADRLRAVVGQPVRVSVADHGPLTGVCLDVAPEWFVLRTDAGQALVPTAAVGWVDGLTREVAPPAGQVLRRLGLASALRALARDRTGLRVVTSAGTVTGTLDRVGADHVDVAEHPAGEPRRAVAVRGVLSVPFAALRVVHGAR